MNSEILFLIKVVRNAAVLGGLMFVSTWATGTLTWVLVKPIIIFFMTYVLSELARYYKISPLEKTKTRRTFIFP